MYWGLRSRINWLKWGNKNTKYFHATTIQRRQRNKLTMLKIDEQHWTRDPKALKQHVMDYYCSLYDSVGPRNIQPILNHCPTVVTTEMNQLLMVDVTEEEVKEAVFQLGS